MCGYVYFYGILRELRGFFFYSGGNGSDGELFGKGL